jgi:hemolysin activation/secretion protein
MNDSNRGKSPMRSGHRHIPAIGIATIALCGATVVHAQVTPSAPTREEVLRDPQMPAPAPIADITVDDGIERAPCPLANAEFSHLRFTLRNVEFSNSAAIDPALLTDSWSTLSGQEVSVAAICEIRDRAATALRRAGYLAAVQVPEQRIEEGVVRLDILAARLTGLQVRGEAGANEGQLARHLSALEGQPLFNARQAERYLLLANSIPGMSARLTLRPSGTPGEVVGEVIVDRQALVIDTSIQNLGSTSVGRFGGIARARFFGLTGLADETSFAVFSTAETDEQQVVQAGHNFRLGGDGLTIGSDFTYAWTRPTLPGNIPLKSETLVWTSFARYPLTLRQARATYLTAGFDWIDQDVRLASLPVTRDRLRIAFARLDASWIDPAALTGRGGFSPAEPRFGGSITLEARQGLGLFGASNGCVTNPLACFAPGVIPVSRIEADTTAFVVRGSGEFSARPTPIVAMVVTPRFQWAARPLLSYEEFSAGNFTFGRGYDPGTIIGDSGIGVSAELRLRSGVPQNANAIAWQPFIFVDAAWVWNEDTTFAGLNPQRLTSVGGGMRLTWGNRAQLDIAVAEPVRAAGLIPFRPDTRLLFTLTTQFGLRR